MRIVVSSMFRDAAATVPQYIRQVGKLRSYAAVRLVVAEGDSTDGTYAMLETLMRPRDVLVRHDHGGPKFRSVNEPRRWAQIAEVMRDLLNNVIDPGDVFLWVESDLWWDAELVMRMIHRMLDDEKIRAICPTVLHGPTDTFYDIWGYRKDGVRFLPQLPYHDGLGDASVALIDSCGSCFAVRGDDFDVVHRWDGVWPFAPECGLWLDRKAVIRHP